MRSRAEHVRAVPRLREQRSGDLGTAPWTAGAPQAKADGDEKPALLLADLVQTTSELQAALEHYVTASRMALAERFIALAQRRIRQTRTRLEQIQEMLARMPGPID
jgi:hypothetical protein